MSWQAIVFAVLASLLVLTLFDLMRMGYAIGHAKETGDATSLLKKVPWLKGHVFVFSDDGKVAVCLQYKRVSYRPEDCPLRGANPHDPQAGKRLREPVQLEQEVLSTLERDAQRLEALGEHDDVEAKVRADAERFRNMRKDR